MTQPQYRQLPAYVAVGAKRDVWQHIVKITAESEDEWAYFRVNALPEAIHALLGRKYHLGTISRALRDLTAEGYIHYRSGTRGQVSMAQPVPDDAQGQASFGPLTDGGGA